MKIYELNLHLSTRLDEKDRDVVWEKIKKVIETEKAEILEEGSFRQIELAYPIKKEVYSFYGHLFFRALPETILVLKELLLHEKAILRYLIFTHKSISRKPVSTRMSRRRERIVEEKKDEIKEGVDETGKADPRSASLGLEKPAIEKEKPVIKKKVIKKIKKGDKKIEKKADPRSASFGLERPKKEPKFKLEDIDKSLEKLLEKEL